MRVLPDREHQIWAESLAPMDGELERMWEHEARTHLLDYHNQSPQALAYIEGVKRGRRINVLLERNGYDQGRY